MVGESLWSPEQCLGTTTVQTIWHLFLLNLFQEIFNHGFFHSVEKNDPKTLVYTNLELFDKSLQGFREYRNPRAIRDLELSKVSHFDNIIQNPKKWKKNHYVGHRISYFLTDRVKQLCRGEVVRILSRLIFTITIFWAFSNIPLHVLTWTLISGIYWQSPIFLSITKSLFWLLACKYGFYMDPSILKLSCLNCVSPGYFLKNLFMFLYSPVGYNHPILTISKQSHPSLQG